MMVEQQIEQESFHTLLWSLFGKVVEEDSLQKARVKAWERFLEIGLPEQKQEAYQYVRLKPFLSRKYESSVWADVTAEALDPYVLPECAQSVLVFINGRFSQTLSRMQALPKRLIAMPLREAMSTYGSFLNSQMTKSLKEESDPLAVINAALHEGGLFIYLPPKTLVESPVQILNVVAANVFPMLVMPRLQVFAGAHSQLSLVSTHAALFEADYACNMVSDISLEEDAHVQMTQALCGIGEKVWHFETLRSSLKRNSTFKTVAVTDGAATVRQDYKVALCGENAETQLNGVWRLDCKRESHVHVFIDHQAPSCRSMQLFKGVLSGESRSSFEGKIMVRQPAQKTEAFQLNNNLLLSERAQADSKPNLEIFADDVKASHGATVGQLDAEQIFYMKARGFAEADAKKLLVNGFCQDVIDLIPISSLYDAMKKVS